MTTEPLATSVHRGYTADLDATQFYRLLRLRIEVFVVEQQCAYQELDGRDLDPTTRHIWINSADERPVAYLRLLEDPDGLLRIGRVCTAPEARGQGLANKLMRVAIAEAHGLPAVVSAQTQVVDFYRAFGFTEVGEEYVEDGIPHVDMRREPVSGR